MRTCHAQSCPFSPSAAIVVYEPKTGTELQRVCACEVHLGGVEKHIKKLFGDVPGLDVKRVLIEKVSEDVPDGVSVF